jgi:2-oxoisovalerate dehydrogenase E2 component (dihydrolipoyl transacylase)
MPAFLLPDLGEGLTEAEIVTWRVQAGDVVAVDQTVVEVETAKAVVEVPVPFAGRVTALHGEPGDVLAVGAPLITVAGADTERDTSPAPHRGTSPTQDMGTGHLATPFAEPGVATPDAAVNHDGGHHDAGHHDAGHHDAGHHDGESGNVLIGYGTSADRRRPRAPRSPAMSSPAPAGHTAASPDTASSDTASPGGAWAGQPPHSGGRVAVVSPLVRRLAREAGLDLTAVRGSGRDGLITRHDVDLAIEARAGEAQPPAPDTSPNSRLAGDPERGTNGVARIPIRGVRKAVADKLSRSRREIPEATVWVDVDATELIRLRATLNADGSAPKISLLAMFSRYTILGLHRYPELNARIEGDEIVLGPAVHLGFAAQTDRGLMVPVVPDAHSCTLEQLSLRLAERTQRARDGQLGPGEMTGGTFTINNYGVFGVDGSAAIINHPEVAILGIGRIIERPWVTGGQIVARQMTQLTLAFDHRVCDGGTAGGFLRFVADCVESPAQAMRNM